MLGLGANPIFFKKKIKIGGPEQSLTPPPSPTPKSDIVSYLPYHSPPPLLKVNVICISPLTRCNNILGCTMSLDINFDDFP